MDAEPPTTAKRLLWTSSGALLLAAVALWGSSRLTWAVEVRGLPGSEVTRTIERPGSEFAPLVPLAVLALAGIAAAVALAGWWRRVVGVVVVAAGLAAIGYSLFKSAPADTDFVAWGRILAVFAGLWMIGAGGTLAWVADRLPRLGSSYQAPAARKRSDDSDGDLWQALSEGKDPTTDDR